MTTTKCTHERTREVPDSTRCFAYSVAVHPYTDENQAAHGGVTYVEECADCGSRRAVNCNGRHSEEGPWGPTRRQREEAERQAAREAMEARLAIEDAALAAHGAKVLRVRDCERPGYHPMVDMVSDGQERSIPLWQIEQAAAQEDNGDGLVPFYRGLLRQV